jgi:pyruvate dehydrogenase kinase 2/3/4
MTSFEGHGTDTCIYLKVLSSEANEMLPVFNKTSSKHYKSHVGSHDWSSSGGPINPNLGNNTSEPMGMRH